mmetsp:Transcript_4352/g.17643  ORF Transcript_4352/g.17643 Transcript_4352/m.17643 type:complete len:265 (-) Transcript_4352:304-1098(-)
MWCAPHRDRAARRRPRAPPSGMMICSWCGVVGATVGWLLLTPGCGKAATLEAATRLVRRRDGVVAVERVVVPDGDAPPLAATSVVRLVVLVVRVSNGPQRALDVVLVVVDVGLRGSSASRQKQRLPFAAAPVVGVSARQVGQKGRRGRAVTRRHRAHAEVAKHPAPQRVGVGRELRIELPEELGFEKLPRLHQPRAVQFADRPEDRLGREPRVERSAVPRVVGALQRDATKTLGEAPEREVLEHHVVGDVKHAPGGGRRRGAAL